MMTLYEILGVTAQATEDEIKSAHRQAVKAHHPDVGGDTRKFQQVQRAYSILSDPERRARYDDTGIEDDPTAVTEEQLANSAIANLIVQFIGSNDDLNTTDIVASMRSALLKQKSAHEEIFSQLNRRIHRVDILRSRLQRKDDGDGVLSSLLAGRERDLHLANSKEKAHIAVVERALSLLDDYTYSLDPTAANQAKIVLP